MEVMEMERISRRAVAGCVCGAVAMMLVSPYRAYAKQGIDFNKRGGSGAKKKAETKYAFRTVPLTDYTRDERTGLLFYDVTEGFGRELSVGDTATVHFDCRFRGIDAVSSRQAALLGGNRTIAQPAVVKVGERPIKGKKGGAGRSDDLLEKSGGLYTGSRGPDPPPALYDMLEGMKVGGRRLVQVEGDEFGFPSGQLEIPPGASFNLEIEVLK